MYRIPRFVQLLYFDLDRILSGKIGYNSLLIIIITINDIDNIINFDFTLHFKL